jgi:ubiquinone biosynthesis UbiH/UbiF/VisC/COQ6 family hydroxylase
VLNGADPFALTIRHSDAPVFGGMAPTELGFLVGNHHIRRALFDALAPLDAALESPTQAVEQNKPLLYAGQAVVSVASHADGARVVLADGQTLHAELLVAADSRHSSTRRALGIAADLYDFGRSMLVCAMTHPEPHHHAAWEWFDHGQTLALLPMNPCPQTGLPRSSVVLTLAGTEMQAIEALAPEAFNTEITRRFAHRLGDMRLSSTRHIYPLVAVYPRRLVGPRFACVGDAACGMHPVTAHGFNLGLKSIDALSQVLQRARQQQRPLYDPALLARYERTHWLASRPVYMATQWIARLDTQEHPPARVLRHTALRLGQAIAPFRQMVAASLTGR